MIYSFRKITLIVVLICASSSFFHARSQDAGCTVALPSIAGSYSGKCKDGLANGKGISRGIDNYEGRFKDGLPDGTGIYTWADGTVYNGHWQAGKRNGKGTMVYADSTVTGYWKDDLYMGKKLISEYEVTRTQSVSRYVIRKSASAKNEIKIRFYQSGSDNRAISNLNLVYSSGNEFRDGGIYGIENVMFPITIKIRYDTPNVMKSSSFTVIFECIINDPGSWDVIISN
jgi:hypothetical protein